jgi:phytoene dehydrogenase-like protein
MVRGRAAALADALVAELTAAGGDRGTIASGTLADLPPARAVLFDVTPRQLVAIAGDRLPGTRRRAERFRYGSGVFKVDWALDGPVPWTADGSRRAATVHLGGTLDEIAAAEAEVAAGRHAERPYVLFVQYAPWDTSRAPAGKTTAWDYCHVPAGSMVDMTDLIVDQVESFAPGFRDRSSPGRRTPGRDGRTTGTTSAATSAASRTSASSSSGRGPRSTRTRR